MELLLIFLVGCAFKDVWDHVKADYGRSRDARVAEVAKRFPGGAIPDDERARAARHHAVGYVAGEVLKGFPVARTGLHAGWIAHKAARARVEAVRVDAHRGHVAAQESLRDRISRYRDAHGEALAERAGDAPEPACRVCMQPGTDADPLVPAGVGLVHRSHNERAEALLQDARDGNAEFAHWLRPGEPVCEVCEGRGRSADGTDACPACRGWGSGPDNPDDPDAGEDAICAACGNPATPGNPVLDHGYTQAHRSHALADVRNQKPGDEPFDPDSPDFEQPDEQALYEDEKDLPGECGLCGDSLASGPNDGWNHDECNRVTSADDAAHEVIDRRDLEAAEADLLAAGRCSYQITPGGWDGPPRFCGRPASGPFCPEHEAAIAGDDERAADERAKRTKDLLAAQSPATEGDTDVTTDTIIPTSAPADLNASSMGGDGVDGDAGSDLASTRQASGALIHLSGNLVSRIEAIIANLSAAHADPLVIAHYEHMLELAEELGGEAGKSDGLLGGVHTDIADAHSAAGGESHVADTHWYAEA